MEDLGAEILIAFCGGKKGRKESIFVRFMNDHFVMKRRCRARCVRYNVTIIEIFKQTFIIVTFHQHNCDLSL